MDPFVIGLGGIIFLCLLLGLGFHIGIALFLAGFAGSAVVSGFQPTITTAVNSFYFKISNPTLVALPLFILMGYLASGGGISRDIYDTLSVWLGRFRSGLGMATVFACTAFGTVCGASVVTAAVFAKISAPEMRRQGYDKSLSYAICAASGTIGMLIPPSILAIIYGTVSGLSIGKVLMAGVAPGILLSITFCLAIIFYGKIKPSSIGGDKGVRLRVSWKEKISLLKSWWSVAIVAVVLFGGMYGGLFTPTEAASVAAFVLIIIYFLKIYMTGASVKAAIHGDFRQSLRDTAITSGLIFVIFGGATVFSQFIVLCGVTTKMAELAGKSGLSPYGLVVACAVIFLILGCFLDGISIVCITIPVLNPIVNAAGVDPVWFATIAILAIEIGLITPPVGLNLYATKGVAEPDVSLEDIIRGILPFLIAELISLAVLFLFPPVATFLPSFIE